MTESRKCQTSQQRSLGPRAPGVGCGFGTPQVAGTRRHFERARACPEGGAGKSGPRGCSWMRPDNPVPWVLAEPGRKIWRHWDAAAPGQPQAQSGRALARL